jgi:rare lipoprotein A
MFAMTAAHRSLPLPTYVRVTNLENGKSVIVRVTDRGPFHANRLIDLSYVAAAKLDILARGTGRVEVKSIDPRDHGGLKVERSHVPAKSRRSLIKTDNIAVHKKITRTKKQNLNSGTVRVERRKQPRNT